MFPCALIVLVVLAYPILQGFAFFRLSGWLRRFAWAILILVVPFCLLMIASVMLEPAKQGTMGSALIQGFLFITACLIADFFLLLLLLLQVVTSSKTPTPL